MLIRLEKLELLLIILGITTAFGYLAARALLWDTFVWILVLPLIALLFILVAPKRYTSMNLNSLDRLIIAYLIYGIIMGAFGILFLNSVPFIIVKGLLHYYLPVIFYFVGRRYTHNSPANSLTIIWVMWGLSGIFLADFLVENYIVTNLQSGLSIPWVAAEVDRLGHVSSVVLNQYAFERVSTVLIGGKRPGFVAAVLFVIVFTLLLDEGRRSNLGFKISSLKFNFIFNIILLTGLGLTLIRLNNKTALLATLLVITFGIFNIRSIRKAAVIGLVGAIAIYFAASTLFNLVESQFITKHAFGEISDDLGLTVFEYTVNPSAIIESYKNADVHAFIFGAQLLDPAGMDPRQVTPASMVGSELRGAGLPIYFGLGWFLIVGSAIFYVLLYSMRLLSIPQWKFFGITMIGLAIVYVSDLHYPSGITHGPLEILVIMTGSLSSIYSYTRKSSQLDMATTKPVESPQHAEKPNTGSKSGNPKQLPSNT